MPKRKRGQGRGGWNNLEWKSSEVREFEVHSAEVTTTRDDDDDDVSCWVLSVILHYYSS